MERGNQEEGSVLPDPQRGIQEEDEHRRKTLCQWIEGAAYARRVRFCIRPQILFGLCRRHLREFEADDRRRRKREGKRLLLTVKAPDGSPPVTYYETGFCRWVDAEFLGGHKSGKSFPSLVACVNLLTGLSYSIEKEEVSSG
jgi:hypothetical protein